MPSPRPLARNDCDRHERTDAVLGGGCGHARRARPPFKSLTATRPGFICREVIVELTWVVERCYGYSRDQIATTARNRIPVPQGI